MAALYGHYLVLPGWLTGPEVCRLEHGGCAVLFRSPRSALLGVPNALLGVMLYVLLAAGLLLHFPTSWLFVLTLPAVAMSAFLGMELDQEPAAVPHLLDRAHRERRAGAAAGDANLLRVMIERAAVTGPPGDFIGAIIGALFVAIGLAAAATASSARPRRDRAGLWFGVFCVLYGVRLEARSELIQSLTQWPGTSLQYTDAFLTYAHSRSGRSLRGGAGRPRVAPAGSPDVAGNLRLRGGGNRQRAGA